MNSVARRTREKEATRARILQAARELFVRDGIGGVTMRGIAQAIEYTPTAIYHHFRDKEALLLELCDHDFRALAQVFLRIGRVEDPVARLRAIGRAYIRFGLEHRSQYRFLFMTEHAELPQSKTDLCRGNPEEDAYAFLRHSVSDAIAAGALLPTYEDADLVSQLLWSGVHGFVALRIFYESDTWIDWRDAALVGDAVVDATLDGILRRPE